MSVRLARSRDFFFVGSFRPFSNSRCEKRNCNSMRCQWLWWAMTRNAIVIKLTEAGEVKSKSFLRPNATPVRNDKEELETRYATFWWTFAFISFPLLPFFMVVSRAFLWSAVLRPAEALAAHEKAALMVAWVIKTNFFEKIHLKSILLELARALSEIFLLQSKSR